MLLTQALIVLCSCLQVAWLSNAQTVQVGYKENVAQAVPSFVIIGTAKSGTTDLYANLVDAVVNKDRARPEPPCVPSHHKESDFLTSLSLDEVAKLSPGSSRHMKYLRHLNHTCADSTADRLSSCMLEMGLQRFTVDAAPAYISSSVAPRALAAISPQSKVIAMLRDPSERASMLFRHFVLEQRNKSIDELADGFFSFLDSRPDIKASLAALRKCPDAACLAAGWHNVSRSGLMSTDVNKLFAGGLYRYMLAAWRVHYLQPGRFMLIDSHAYFGNRTAVMEQVTYFLYGRAMTRSELGAATALSFWPKGASAIAASGQRWVMSEQRRSRLQQFYAEHVLQGFDAMLADMRAAGAAVVGFDGEPWTQANRARSA